MRRGRRSGSPFKPQIREARMLGIWLSVAQVVISGYQPIAEQTWVQLNPEYYPLARTPPAMFVAWRGNQFPPLAQKQKHGRWQILFPARLVPPSICSRGRRSSPKPIWQGCGASTRWLTGSSPGRLLRLVQSCSRGVVPLLIMRNLSLPLLPSSAHPKTRLVVLICPATPTRANLCSLSWG